MIWLKFITDNYSSCPLLIPRAEHTSEKKRIKKMPDLNVSLLSASMLTSDANSQTDDRKYCIECTEISLTNEFVMTSLINIVLGM